MTPAGVRKLRLGLVAAALLVGVAVAKTLRHRDPTAPLPPTRAGAKSPGANMAAGFVYRKFKQGQENFTLRAESMEGQEQDQVKLKGVDMSFPYFAHGEQGQATVKSEQGHYDPNGPHAEFEGHVVVTTQDGLELLTDTLIYKGDKQLARTESPVTFSRPLKERRLTGRCTGMVYNAGEGKLELSADAFIRIESPDAPPLEVTSDSGSADRESGVLTFDGHVEARRGEDWIKADTVNLVFADERLIGLEAVGDVELDAKGGHAIQAVPGQAAGASGRRHLSSNRLDVYFNEDHTLRSATAGPDAKLTLLPGPGDPREKREIRARLITFQFDEQGRLVEVQAQKDAALALEDLPPARQKPRTLTCRSFVAHIDPSSGHVSDVNFQRDVEIVRETQHARADTAEYDGKASQLRLEGDPELRDASDGGRLTAGSIEIGTDVGDIRAKGGVHHTVGSKPGDKDRVAGSDAPTTISAGKLRYDAKAHETEYRDDVVLVSGNDEVQAPWLRLKEPQPGKRQLSAGTGVLALLRPAPRPGQSPPQQAEVRAQTLAYDDVSGQAVFDGDVVIKQGDLISKSPKATAQFNADGSAVEKLTAGDPVDVQQGTKSASGSLATYSLAEKTLVMVGERVLLKEPGQQIVGRSLTFVSGNDRILIDGREEARTETILKHEPPKP